MVSALYREPGQRPRANDSKLWSAPARILYPAWLLRSSDFPGAMSTGADLQGLGVLGMTPGPVLMPMQRNGSKGVPCMKTAHDDIVPAVADVGGQVPS